METDQTPTNRRRNKERPSGSGGNHRNTVVKIVREDCSTGSLGRKKFESPKPSRSPHNRSQNNSSNLKTGGGSKPTITKVQSQQQPQANSNFYQTM